MIIALGALLVSYIFPLGMFFFLRNNRKDDQEFRKNCGKLLWNGMLLGIPVFLFSLVCNILFNLTGLSELHPLAKNFFKAFILQAFSEELMKYLTARRVIRKNFSQNSFLDIMTYTCIPAIGFEIMEAIIYLFESNVPQIIVRGVTNMHAVFGLITGFIIAKGYKNGQKKPAVPAVLIATLIHGTYDLCLDEGIVETAWGGLALLIAVVCLVLHIYSYFFMRKARKNSYYTGPLFPAPEPEAAAEIE